MRHRATQDFSLVQAFGKLSITSDPTGAEVVMDGKSYGVTPLKIDSFPVGDYALDAQAGGQQGHHRYALRRKRASALAKQYKFDLALGGLAISTDPAGASITIDGQATGQIAPFTFSTLKEGTHEIYLELPGYLPWSGEVIGVQRPDEPPLHRPHEAAVENRLTDEHLSVYTTEAVQDGETAVPCRPESAYRGPCWACGTHVSETVPVEGVEGCKPCNGKL